MQRFLKKRRVKYNVTPLKVDRVIRKKSFQLTDTQKLAKTIAFEISGLQPYEKKAIEYIKGDNIKKAIKFLKIRLGSLARGEKKLERLMKLSK